MASTNEFEEKLSFIEQLVKVDKRLAEWAMQQFVQGFTVADCRTILKNIVANTERA